MGQRIIQTGDSGTVGLADTDGMDEIGISPPPVPPVVPSAPPAPPPVAASADGPLSAEDLRQIEQANLRAKKIRKAGGVAMFNGITIACFGGFSALLALASPLFGGFDVTAAVMAAAFGLAAFNEFKGRRLFRAFDRRAPRLLGWNQLGLMVLLIGYCTWMIVSTCLGPHPYADAMAREPMLADTLGPLGDLHVLLTLALYGGVTVGTMIFQGLNAAYYFTRAKHLAAYLDETPDWVVDVQRRSAGE